jgi:hypothetical protein
MTGQLRLQAAWSETALSSVLKIDVVHQDLGFSEFGVVETLIDPLHKVGKLIEKPCSPGFVLINGNWLENEHRVADKLLFQIIELYFEADVFVEAIFIEQREQLVKLPFSIVQITKERRHGHDAIHIFQWVGVWGDGIWIRLHYEKLMIKESKSECSRRSKWKQCSLISFNREHTKTVNLTHQQT